jgi:ferritin-like protein
MATPQQPDSSDSTAEVQSSLDRRTFLKRASVISATTVLGLGALLNGFPAQAAEEEVKSKPLHVKKRDKDILIAAQIAEALAVTTYSNIINTSPFFTRIPSDDQGYLQAALQEEMSHYALEKSVSGEDSPFTTFFYPHNMFTDAQTTLNVLVTLEDAFIAAYLVGVRDFSTADLRVTAARIMGIESDHRTLARVVAPDVASMDGGPIENVTGVQGTSESVDPPNNNGYERTLSWTMISQAVTALTPFVDMAAATTAGFDTTKPFTFVPFTPTLPSTLGEFISFIG